MKMSSFAPNDFWFFVRQRDLLPGVIGGVERLQLSIYDRSDLVSPNRFWIFSHGCREKDYPRSFYFGCYILDNGDSYSRLSNDITRLVGFIS
jgi:hypothetical protein